MEYNKTFRGIVKRLIPFDIQRIYMERTYGIYLSAGRSLGRLTEGLIGMIPYGLVCHFFKVRPTRALRCSSFKRPFWFSLIEPRYRLSLWRRIQFLRERKKGKIEFRDVINKNYDVKILAVLHLFYPKSWPLIKMYLDNLSPYRNTHFIVTYIPGTLPDKLLRKIEKFAPRVTLLPCPNKGFDVGPFAEALQTVDLNDYDVVFKLQSKGIKRWKIFIYGQIFKRTDWFFNLWEGVLGGRTVHLAIDALMNKGYKLAAAENLIVSDPVHKRNFVRTFCRERNIPFVEGYRYVAGSMFAVRVDALKPFKALWLGCDDFPETARGTFSAAHSLERWMCFAANDGLFGVPTAHNEYKKQVQTMQAKSALRLQDDPRIKIDDDFFYRRLETRPINRYDIVRLKLRDIRRIRYDGRIVMLEECEPYRYLVGEKDLYHEYCETNRIESGFEMSQERFDALVSSMTQAYDARYLPVVSGNNILMDGQHRCCFLLYKYGPDHEIDVLKIS